MAEIRKHNPKLSNPIDVALAAALGEPVRPVAPGSARKEAAPVEDEGTRAPAITVTGVTMGEGQWLQVQGKKLKGFGTQPVEPRECEES